jgi:hypothetical protein
MLLAIATVLLSVLTAAPADVTGRWEGSLTATANDGTKHDDTVLLILTQKGNAISGTVGESEDDQHPISTGTIEGDKLVLVAKHLTNGREYRLELTLKDDELSGTVTSGEMRAEVRAKRRKG